ncbi:MAG: transketolase [Alphaproteobacteria bacterium]|nr:transketolase [Alphaproteobacteria bacterium]
MITTLKNMSNAIRCLSMDAVQKANSGHPGMPMGMADVATVLFTKFLKYDSQCLDWADRDRFILSAGHGSMLLYSLSYLTGNDDCSIEDIKDFRQLNAKTAGHPEYGHMKGIETTTGPLGQGITNSVGFALAERMLNARFGDNLVNHKTYVIAGDGCLMEGISQEAITMAGHWKLSNLIVLWDDNDISIDGKISLASSENQKLRFESAGWKVISCDGHNFDDIENALNQAQDSDKPVMIACKTVIGKGSPNKSGTASCHGAPLGNDEIAKAKQELGCDWEPFVIPDDVLNAWRSVGKSGQDARIEWEKRLESSDKKSDFHKCLNPDLGKEFLTAINKIKQNASSDQNKIATRKASQIVLEELYKEIPQLIGGSADLSGSNLTKTNDMDVIQANNYGGSYIHYGIREHGMGAVMNGIALHGGFVPYGGTFMVFADYCRPAIRLSALMGIRSIYVMTHDSIGLGEDGPTHQPVEHLASLRAIPNLLNFRPADLVETAEVWALALQHKNTPSILALSRQGLPTVRTKHTDNNLSAKGAYVLSDCDGERDGTIIATGSEVEIALNAQSELIKQGIKVAVVSMPCMELFIKQDEDYKMSVIGTAPRVGIEAGLKMGWDCVLRREDGFVGMDSFGASAPADELYKHFGITVDNLVSQIKQRI